MKHAYFSYFEGINSKGEVILSGNGCLECDGSPADHHAIDEYGEYLLQQAKLKNSSVIRVVIKQLTKL